MEKQLELTSYLPILKRMIESEIARFKWDINYHTEHSRDLMRDELLVLKGKVAGLQSSLKLVDSAVKELQHELKFNEFIDGMTSKIDQMMELIDKNRPKRDSQ